jgi:hypothetical protein
MKYSLPIAGGIFGSLILAGSACAASFQESMDSCLSRYANPRDAASVMLECNADNGKLSDCKVVESKAPSKGFEKAAMCVAEALPMGSKTGTIKVPIRFAGGG